MEKINKAIDNLADIIIKRSDYEGTVQNEERIVAIHADLIRKKEESEQLERYLKLRYALLDVKAKKRRMNKLLREEIDFWSTPF